MKKLFVFVLTVVFAFTILVPQSRVQAQESQSGEVQIPDEVLEALPEELREILTGRMITKEQYELYLELIEKENSE
ncbi:hypothetical protein J2T13_000650 [Paenibacillus sp. DS2015]|uniref:hypothetical protein n=1 Tax=Paenibacillus sp. DS2015 TaxID=3373917 RepID=UPI003D2326E6